MYKGNGNTLVCNNVATVKPGHFGTSHFYPLYEGCPLSEVKKCISILWESEHLGPGKVSFIERFFLLCPLFGGSSIGGSTVAPSLVTHVYNYTVNLSDKETGETPPLMAQLPS